MLRVRDAGTSGLHPGCASRCKTRHRRTGATQGRRSCPCRCSRSGSKRSSFCTIRGVGEAGEADQADGVVGPARQHDFAARIPEKAARGRSVGCAAVNTARTHRQGEINNWRSSPPSSPARVVPGGWLNVVATSRELHIELCGKVFPTETLLFMEKHCFLSK